jgi:hypothetical protein
MRTKLKLVVYILLACLCIGIFAGCRANDDGGPDNYTWYIKIYMPDCCIEGPGTILNWYGCGLVLVEIDGIRYKVGSQNFLARKLPTP